MKNKRLFVDMDGTLNYFQSIDTIELLYEENYFLNLKPIENIVLSIKEIINNHKDIEVFILSSVLEDSKFAKNEKNLWLNKYLPEIDMKHRIFSRYGHDKTSFIEGGICENDFLLDDYTPNLYSFEPPAKGIKLLNGINNTKGTWKKNKIDYSKNSSEITKNIYDIIINGVTIQDSQPRRIEQFVEIATIDQNPFLNNELYDIQYNNWKNQIINIIHSDNFYGLEWSDKNGTKNIFTRSIKDGDWQLSLIDKNGIPLGDSQWLDSEIGKTGGYFDALSVFPTSNTNNKLIARVIYQNNANINNERILNNMKEPSFSMNDFVSFHDSLRFCEFVRDTTNINISVEQATVLFNYMEGHGYLIGFFPKQNSNLIAKIDINSIPFSTNEKDKLLNDPNSDILSFESLDDIFYSVSLWNDELQEQDDINEEYLNTLKEDSAILESIDFTKTNFSDVKFFVAECMEFHSLGEFHTNIESIDEAIQIFKSIPDSKKSLVGGIGVTISIEKYGEKDLPINLTPLERDGLSSYYPEIRWNPIILQALDVLEKEFSSPTLKDDVSKSVSTHGEQTKKIDDGIEKMESQTSLSISSDEKEKSPSQELMEKLKSGIKNTLDSEQFALWCKRQGRIFTNAYSFNNSMLIYLQNPNASYVCGYESWKDFGRQVVANAKGLKIFTPSYLKNSKERNYFFHIKKECLEQFNTNKDIEFATFSIGSLLSVNMYKNGLFDIKQMGKVVLSHGTEESARKFFESNKIPIGYGIATVFDIADTTPDVEFLWVNKDKCQKHELALNEKGEIQKNKKGQVKIYNSDIRRSGFNSDFMKLDDSSVLTSSQLELLFNTLCSICNKNNVPVLVLSKSIDVTLNDGALGYFQRPNLTNESDLKLFPNGKIVLSDELSVLDKTTVLFHEMAHSELHYDLDKIKNEMGGITISSQLKEVQAEAVAYMCASRFGIETDHKSFNYIANWTSSRELEELEKSLSVIYKESLSLMNRIESELNSRGYSVSLNPIEQVMDSNIEKFDFLKEMKGFYLETSKQIEMQVKGAILELENSSGIEFDILKEQVVLFQNSLSSLDEFNSLLPSYESEQDFIVLANLKADIIALKERVILTKQKVDSLSNERISVLSNDSSNETKNLKSLFSKNPNEVFEILSSDFPMLKLLSDNDKLFISKSPFISQHYKKHLGVNNGLFVSLAISHLANAIKVSSSNKFFVEINSCENWSNSPYFEKGTLLHPKEANKVLKAAEKHCLEQKSLSAEKGVYYPYTKCSMTFCYVDSSSKLNMVKTRIDIGDGFQKDLNDFIQKTFGAKSIDSIPELSSSYSLALKDKKIPSSLVSPIKVDKILDSDSINDVLPLDSWSSLVNSSFEKNDSEKDSVSITSEKEVEHENISSF